MDYPRRELLDHVAGRQNLCLLVPRQIGTATWRHAFIADAPANDCVISNRSREANQVFPLSRFNSQGAPAENLSPKFRTFLDARYEHHYSPEEILGYIYAVLYAPAYRARYAEFLRIDFPRIPFPESAEHFEALSGLGWALVQAHLLRELSRPGLAAYHGKGDHAVEAVRYSPEEQAVWINKSQFFKPVPQAVWDFHIGGYQALEKYLKSRKGRTLSLDEIDHVSAVANSLAFTIEQMAAIDAAYPAAGIMPRQGSRARSASGIVASRNSIRAPDHGQTNGAQQRGGPVRDRNATGPVRPGRGGSSLSARPRQGARATSSDSRRGAGGPIFSVGANARQPLPHDLPANDPLAARGRSGPVALRVRGRTCPAWGRVTAVGSERAAHFTDRVRPVRAGANCAQIGRR